MKADETKVFIERTLTRGTSSKRIKSIYSETTTLPKHFLEDCIHAGKISPGKTLLNTEETQSTSAILKWDKTTSPCVVLAIEKFIDNNKLLDKQKKCDLLLIPEEGSAYIVFAELSSCKEIYRDKKEGDARQQLENTIKALHPGGNPYLGGYVKKLAIFFWRDSDGDLTQDVASQSMLGFTSLPQTHIISEEPLCHHFRYVRWAYPQPFHLPPSW